MAKVRLRNHLIDGQRRAEDGLASGRGGFRQDGGRDLPAVGHGPGQVPSGCPEEFLGPGGRADGEHVGSEPIGVRDGTRTSSWRNTSATTTVTARISRGRSGHPTTKTSQYRRDGRAMPMVSDAVHEL